ncbi:hypothetical protein IL38_24160 [Actinopolyspora erythraea]|uniref:PKD domain-containing protein n=1 Tax=Actinopolyspora erythraea TaxID=414996 RepID=A0ABR4WYM3_9ACTN|nr:PKD domain-containing protein [Actinopolyspora erythraea]KGI79392.1 hypothetical protein IL38_24160 [Actinopolyspora erythraea]
MPILLPARDQPIGELIVEVERLGGRMKTDYHCTYVGIHQALHVSDALYEQWVAAHGQSHAAGTSTASSAPRALSGGVSSAAEHHTHSHLATQGRVSVAERNLHNYPASRDGNTITPRTAHDQADAPVVTVSKTGNPREVSLTADNGGRPVTIQWGDGSADGSNPGDGTTATTHVYPEETAYTITVFDAEDPGASTTTQVDFTPAAEGNESVASDTTSGDDGQGATAAALDEGDSAGSEGRPEPITVETGVTTNPSETDSETGSEGGGTTTGARSGASRRTSRGKGK